MNTNQNRIDRTVEQIEQNTTIQYILLIGIMVLAAVLRLYKIGEWGFWIDEIFTINRALGDLGSLLIPTSLRLINIPMSILGVSEFSSRLVPGLLGILSIPIFFFPVRKITNGTIALIFTLLLALSPWHLFWSQNARYYTALMLFYGLASLCLFIWLESENRWYLVFSMVLIGLAMLERGTTLFIFPVLVVYILALYLLPVEKPPGLRWRNLALFFVPMLILGLLVVFLSGNVFSFFTKIVGFQHNPIRVAFGVIYDLGLPLFLLAICGGIYSSVKKSRLGLFLLIGTLVPFVILLIVSPFVLAVSRYIFQTLPLWLMLGAIAIKAIVDNASGNGKYLALGFALLLVADSVSQNFLYFNYQNGNREDFKGAFEIVAEHKLLDDLIVSGRPEIGRYYLNDKVKSARNVKIEDIENSDQQTLFVVDNRSGFPSKLQEWIEDNSQLIGVRDVYVPGKVMMMRVYLYQPRAP